MENIYDGDTNQFLREITNKKYFEIVDGVSLESIRPKNSHGFSAPIVACTAVFAGEVRLIDNLMLFP
jgi:pantothenate synthetase